jgi:murein DD-endopeptidase MepM/ murein hydrolase activator NlpD
MLSTSLLQASAHRFDFSPRNKAVERIDMAKRGTLQAHVAHTLTSVGKTWGFGGYGEDRSFYRSPLFTKDGEPRTVHLGIDVWLPARTLVFAPIIGVVHSFQNNQHFLDYGPTVILEHTVSSVHFYTLYGHLSTDSLTGLSVGKEVPAGTELARLGTEAENGNWAPHLHFQIIGDLLGKSGDFPAVAKRSEKDFYLALCPNPELLFWVG